MRGITISFALFFFLFFFTTPCFADPTPTPGVSPTPAVPQNVFTDTPAASSGVLSAFFSGFDWISSGLIFSTPSLLDNTIHLADGTTLSGVSQYRTLFYDIASPLFVIIISVIALSHITYDNSLELKNFFKRLVFVVGLFIITPYLLYYSIEFINLLNTEIMGQNGTSLTTFLTTYLTSSNFTNLFSVLTPTSLFSFGTIMQLIIFLVAIGFFLLGFLYIVFQAMFRFIALLFLSVIFPLVLPFALSRRTENITNSYFRTWFTFLIQQPAFVLGFAIMTAIFESILSTHGGSIGTLFLFSASLMFLGGVNVFVGRIFGDGWSLVAINAQSALASGAVGIATFQEVKRGAISGRPTGIRSYAGAYFSKKIGLLSGGKTTGLPTGDEGREKNGNTSPASTGAQTDFGIQPSGKSSPFTTALQQQGIETELVDDKNGVVKLSGRGYSYTHPVSGLKEIYASKKDAKNDGRDEKELTPVPLRGNYIDFSNPEGKREYNTRVSTRKKEVHFSGDTHLTKDADPKRGRNFLCVGKDILDKDDIDGVIVKRYGNNNGQKSKGQVIRIYRQKPL